MPNQPEFIDWPVWKWPGLGWVFTVVGTLIGVALLVFPEVTDASIFWRLVVLVILVLLPATFLFALHAFATLAVFISRGTEYVSLHSKISEYAKDLENATKVIDGFLTERQEKWSLKIDYCYFFEPNIVVMKLKKKRGFSAKVSQQFTVFDKVESRYLGTVEITEIDSDGYTSVAKPGLDPIWLGHIRNLGAGHSQPPPNAIALLINNESSEN